MNDKERQELRDWAARLMEWHKVYRTKLWTVTECYEGECDIWVNKKGEQQAKAEEDSYVCGDLWQPDSPDAPAWQILGVIEAMNKLGWKLSTIGNNAMFDFNHCEIMTNWFKADNLFDAILLAAYSALEDK